MGLKEIGHIYLLSFAFFGSKSCAEGLKAFALSKPWTPIAAGFVGSRYIGSNPSILKLKKKH